MFRQISKGGRIGATALGDDGYVRAIKKRARAAGLDPALVFRPQPARRLPDQSPSEHGASTFKLQEVSRHRSLDVLSRLRAAVGPVQRPCGSWILVMLAPARRGPVAG